MSAGTFVFNVGGFAPTLPHKFPELLGAGEGSPEPG